MDAYDGDEADSLKDAVRLGVTATGEDLLGVRVAADLQKAVDGRQRRFSYSDRRSVRRVAGGVTTAEGSTS